MSFFKLENSSQISQSKNWDKMVLSIIKRGDTFVLRLNFRISYLKKIGITPYDKIDLFIGEKEDARKIIITKGSLYNLQFSDKKETSARFSLPIFVGMKKEKVPFHKCVSLINDNQIIFQLTENLFTDTKNRIFNRIENKLELKDIKYMNEQNSSPENNVN